MKGYLNDVMRLYLSQLVDWESYFHLRKGEGVDVEAEKAALLEVLETGAQICASVEPEARERWYEAARLDGGGEVVLPEHIRGAIEKLTDSGLISYSVEEEYGGFGLPSLVANILLQMIARADAGLMTIIGLQTGVAEDIQRYGDDEIKRQYLPRFASGEVMGSMDLTEPQAGSDLGAIQTRAAEKDGRFFIEGQKIFITNGGSEIHLVLARDDDTYDASKGTTRGLSLYLVPKRLPDGTHNAMKVVRLEHKLGIHGSPTAQMQFDRAEGFLLGTKGEGFKAMLSLMNNARLGVAAQGIGVSEAALAAATRYARERKQFGVPIGEMPLMKNMLSRMVLALEGGRALLYRACALVDRNRAIEKALERGGLSPGEAAELEKQHERNDVRIRLLTPLAKYMATENCVEITRAAIQVHGGIGFMSESEVAKLHQDAIITTIYEGTSEIQASFALREIGKGALGIVFEEVQKELEAMSEPPLVELAEKVRVGIGLILDASVALLADFNYALMSAHYVAEMASSVIVAAELLKQAKLDAARFELAASWINRRMLELEARAKRVKDGTPARLDRAEKILALLD